jgi:hypothetical protein
MTNVSTKARSLEALILQLDANAHDCRLKIAALREEMDGACDRQEISLSEWRSLVDAVSHTRSLCEGANDARGNNGTIYRPPAQA